MYAGGGNSDTPKLSMTLKLDRGSLTAITLS